ncbi:MAG: hypothetical protein IKO74_12330 [Selenomonadaceae bacterium]|nr:hypothetical protein [Selenomonadaceae bacterium]
MGLGICAGAYVQRPDLQLLFRLRMGGAAELPCEIRKRLDERQDNRRRRIKKRKFRQH